MYNRYIPNGTSYTRVTVPDSPSQQVSRTQSPPQPSEPSPQQESPRPPQANPSSPRSGSQKAWAKDPLTSLLGSIGGGRESRLTGMFDKLKLNDIDNGDILLILILLFLFRDGEDLELVIALGLLLLLGLGDSEKKAPQSEPS